MTSGIHRFGHAGERALAAAMAAYGGFDHNAQSFKVVTRLERKYASFDGLNLTFETLEGLAKHNGPVPDGERQAPLRTAIAESGLERKLHLPLFAPAEAQVAAIADDIAYDSHDLDDGLRAGLLRIEELATVALVGRFLDDVPRKNIDTQRLIYEINRRMITAMIDDAVRQIAAPACQLAAAKPRACGGPIAPWWPSPRALRARPRASRRTSCANVYRHPRVMRIMADAEAIVSDLFARYLRQPEEMSGALGEAGQAASGGSRAAIVADFVAGMTGSLRHQGTSSVV